MKKTIRNLFTIVIIFNSIFINKLIGQTRMNFVKGEELNNISFVEKGSLFTFTSDDVWLNNNLLNKRGPIRFTKKYMVYPCTIKTSDTEMEIDVYFSLGNYNYDCIIDWGGNVLENFKLIEIDLDEYNENIEKDNKNKKNQFLAKLKEIQNFSEIDTTDLTKLNLRQIELSKLLKSYSANYNHLFVFDPTEISQIRIELNRISTVIQKINLVESKRNKFQDSMRIFRMRVVLPHKSERLDTVEVLKRGVAVLLNVLLPDSLSRINDKLDSIYLIKCKKVVNYLEISKTVELYKGQYFSICQLDFPISEIFALQHENGLIYSSKNIKSDFIYQQRKIELYKVQELNAISEIIGYMRNAMKFSMSCKNINSTLKKGEVYWNAKYDFDIVYNSNFDTLKSYLKNLVSYFDFRNFEKNADLKNTNTYKMILDNEADEITLLNTLSISLFKEFAYDLVEKYPSNWKFQFANNSYYYGFFPCFGKTYDSTGEYRYNRGNNNLWKRNQYNETEDFPFLGNVLEVSDFSNLWKDIDNDVFRFNLPQSLKTIRKYFLSLNFEDKFLENYTEKPDITFVNTMNYSSGGFEKKIYSYGRIINNNHSVFNGIFKTRNTDEFRDSRHDLWVRYDSLQHYHFDREYAFAAMPILLENYHSTAINPSIFFRYNFKTQPQLDPFYDTSTRKFEFITGGGKNGKKPFSINLTPTAFNVQIAPINIFTSTNTPFSETIINRNILISYKNWEWHHGSDDYMEYLFAIQWLKYVGDINFYSSWKNSNARKIYGFSVNKIVD
jgi:hypothetical protein